MILSCNSCYKKFVVPDQAITAAGRMVQCGSCGNKWKQFPIKNEDKKVREINLYSPEYLEKKHGISLNNINNSKINKTISNKKAAFGFYNSFIVLIVFVIALTKILHFSQDVIVFNFPFTEIYFDILFENIKNIFEIFKSLVIYY